jgi:uncharacterized membrane protein YjgN (DUF898 family)
MQGIYNCIPDTNHVYRVYGVPAVLYLQALHIIIIIIIIGVIRNVYCSEVYQALPSRGSGKLREEVRQIYLRNRPN